MATNVRKECNVVMVGKTGNGKSSLGNSLLRHTMGNPKPFESKMSSNSITKKCKRQQHVLEDGTRLTVVDTPGLFDTDKPNDDTIKELVKCIALCAPGPHVILFVLSIKRFTLEEINAVEILTQLFGVDALKHVIIVFTGKDMLAEEDDGPQTIEDYVEQSSESLQSFIYKFGSRYVGIANKPKSLTHDSDVTDVMQLIYETMAENENQVYSQEAFAKAEKMLKEEIEQRRQREQEKESERRQEIFLEGYTRGTESEREAKERIRENLKQEIESEGGFFTKLWRRLKDFFCKIFGR